MIRRRRLAVGAIALVSVWLSAAAAVVLAEPWASAAALPASDAAPQGGFELTIMQSTQGNFGKLGIGVGDTGGGGSYLDENGVRRDGLHASLSIAIEGEPSQFRQPEVYEGQTLKVDGYRILIERILPDATPRGCIVVRVWMP